MAKYLGENIGFDWEQMYSAWKRYLDLDSDMPGMTNKQLMGINPFYFLTRLHLL